MSVTSITCCDKSPASPVWWAVPLLRLNLGVPSDYRLSASVTVRILGAVLVAAGLVVGLVAVIAAVLGWPGVVTLVVAVGLWAVVAGLALLLLRLAPVVRLDEAGYRVRWVRGAGVREARWKDVEDVVASTVGGARCVVLRHRDGRTTTIPVDLLSAPVESFVEDLRAHLNRGRGYRPLR